MTASTEQEISDFGLLFGALARSRVEGTLRVQSESTEKFIHLREGRVEGIFTTRSRFRIGEILHDMRAVERADLDRVLAGQSKDEGRVPLGEELLERGLIKEGDLEDGLRHQMVEELLDVFLWKRLSYEFIGGRVERALPRISQRLFRVGGSQEAQGVLQSVVETIADIERFRGAAPSVRDIYEIVELPDDDTCYRLLELVNGTRSLSEILGAARLNRFIAMKLVYQLIEGGYIRVLDGRELELLALEDGDQLGDEKTASVLERAYELGARGRDAALRAGEVYEALSNGKRAAERYRDYSRLCLAAGDLDLAEQGADRAIAALPGSVEMRELKIEILGRLRRQEDLARELTRLADLHRERIEYEFEAATLARVRRLRPRDPSVAGLHAQAIENAASGPCAARAWVVAAELHRRAENFVETEAALRAAAACAPRSFRFRKLLVRFLARNDATDQAAAELLELIALVRERTRQRLHGSGRGLRALMRLLADAGLEASPAGPVLAEALLEIGENGAAAKVLRWAGRGCAENGDLAEARTAFRRVLALFPGDGRTGEALADLHLEQGEVRHAVAELLGAAGNHKRHGDIDDAVRVLRRVLEVRPENFEALRALSVYARKIGDSREAAALGARFGHSLRAAGRPEDAVVQYNRACTLDPSEPAHARDLSILLGGVLGADEESTGILPTLSRLRERGEHVGVIGASLRALSREGDSEEMRELLLDSYEALGREITSDTRS